MGVCEIAVKAVKFRESGGECGEKILSPGSGEIK